MSRTAMMVMFILTALMLGASFNARAQNTTIAACSEADAPAGCKDNMWALHVDVNVQPGAYVFVPNPGCMNDSNDQVAKLVQTALSTGGPALKFFSGPIAAIAAQPIAAAFKQSGGDLSKMFSPYAKNGALCAPVIGIVPIDAEVVGFRLLATDEHNANVMKKCSAAADCPIGWSKFQSEPVESKSAAMRVYTSIFMNWSADRSRKAEMIIFFKLPSGKKPLQEL